MSPSAEERIPSLGRRLSQNLSKNDLLKTLKETAGCLTELNQSPSLGVLLKKVNEVLVRPAFLHSRDKDVRLLVSACFSEIMRILAPDTPYSDEVLKDIFKLFVITFKELNETKSSHFLRMDRILETIAKVKCCILMLDLECDELILEMFRVFFSVVREDHSSNVLQNVSAIMEMIIEESTEISQPLLDVILSNLLKDNKNVTSAAHKLALSVVQHCAEKLEPCIQRFLSSVIVERASCGSDLHEHYHDIIFEIYQCAPKMLLPVIQNLTQELLMDNVDIRLKAVCLLGRLFALPGQYVANEYRHLFCEFLKRFSDKAVEVRLAAVECAKDCFLSNPFGTEAAEILSGLKDRLLDFDEKVRVLSVNVICDLAKSNQKLVPVDIIKDVSERLRDKKASVRKDTLQKLVELYRSYCTKCSDCPLKLDEQYEWIPSKILKLFYDKDCKEFRLSGMETLFAEDLFPCKLPMDERARHWILSFSLFCSTDITAFEYILCQKQRLQKEMQMYLSLRQKLKEEDSEDLKKEVEKLLKTMSICFVDPLKTQEGFHKLHQMKDNNIFKAISLLLDSETTLENSFLIREDLLKRIGKRHPQYDFLKALSIRCSYALFNKELVKAIFKNILSCKMASNQRFERAAIDLLVRIVNFFPFLVKGSDEEVQHLLEKEDDFMTDKATEIVAKTGHLLKMDGSVLEKLKHRCWTGSRRQAKHAVFALAALTAESGHETLVHLYEQLLQFLETSQCLSSVLQSLGCIAQAAVTVFESHEDEIIKFIVRKLLKRHCERESSDGKDNDHSCAVCQIKIYGLKTLVKSFLPKKEGCPRRRIKDFLGMLGKLIQNGGVSEEAQSSDADKAHIRLAAAMAVLKLGKRWEHHISPQLFHHTVLRAQDSSVYVRKRFLHKINKYLRSHAINIKYASGFALAASDDDPSIQDIAKKFLVDFALNCYREAQVRQTTTQMDHERSSLTFFPEYVLVYLIHVLAHHPKFPTEAEAENEEAYEPFYRPLLAYLQALLCQIPDDNSRKNSRDNLTIILSILHAIKKSIDAVDKQATDNLYVLCDIGILLAKELGHSIASCSQIPGGVPLPSSLYKACECNGEGKIDGSSLPTFLRENKSLTKLIRGSFLPCQPKTSTPYGKRHRRNPVDSTVDETLKESNLPFQKSSIASDLGHSLEDDRHEKTVQSKRKQGCYQNQSSRLRCRRLSAGEKKGEKLVHGEKEKQQRVRRAISKVHQKFSNKKSVANSDNQLEQSETTDNVTSMFASDSIETPGESSKEKDDSLCPEKAGEDFDDNASNIEGCLEICSEEDIGRNAKRNMKRSKNLETKDLAKVKEKASKNRRETRSIFMTTGKSPTCNDPINEGEDALLIGKKIKIWWPVEKRFYFGTINGFDSVTKTHKVSYDDGGTELIHLPHEQWEIIDKSEKDVPNLGSKGRKRRREPSKKVKSRNVKSTSATTCEMGIDPMGYSSESSEDVYREMLHDTDKKQSSVAATKDSANKIEHSKLQDRKSVKRGERTTAHSKTFGTENKPLERRRTRRYNQDL